MRSTDVRLLLFPHMVETASEGALWSFLRKGANCIRKRSPSGSLGPCPNAITLGVGVSAYEFEGDTDIQTIVMFQTAPLPPLTGHEWKGVDLTGEGTEPGMMIGQPGQTFVTCALPDKYPGHSAQFSRIENSGDQVGWSVDFTKLVRVVVLLTCPLSSWNGSLVHHAQGSDSKGTQGAHVSSHRKKQLQLSLCSEGPGGNPWSMFPVPKLDSSPPASFCVPMAP